MTLLYGRISTCVTSLCGMKLALTIALRYAHSRRQFAMPSQVASSNDDLVILESPIINYQSHQVRIFCARKQKQPTTTFFFFLNFKQRALLPYLASSFAMHFTLDFMKLRMKQIATEYNSKLAAMKNELMADQDISEFQALAGALKAYITKTNVQCAQACRECCGSLGFASVNRLGFIRDAADAALSYESANAVLIQSAARHLLNAVRKQFTARGQMITSLQFLLKNLKHSFTEMNPMNLRNKNAASYLESELFQLKAFEYREQTLILELANSLQQQSSSTEDAWNNNLELVHELTSAHVERVMLQQFINFVNSPRVDDKVKPILGKLRSLFALDCMNRDSFFLEHRYIAGSKAMAINQSVNTICKELLPHVRSIVDAFGYPDHVIRAPIAGDWISYYKA